MSRQEIADLQRVVNSSPTKENYDALVAAQLRFMEAQLNVKTAAEKRAAVAKTEAEVLRCEIGELRSQQPTGPPKLTAEERAQYYEKWMSLLKEFNMRKEVLSYFLSYSAEEFKQAELTTVSRWLDTWTTFFESAQTSEKSLKRLARGRADGDTLPSTDPLNNALDELCRLQKQVRTLVGRERYSRSSSSEEAVQDVMDSQRQLKEWCHKQRETLAALRTLDDLMEFSNSFSTNVPVMDSNFLVLTEQSEALMDKVPVQEALEEVHREWILLALETYDKLHTAATEAHENSSLEQLSALWIQSASSVLRRFLISAQRKLDQGAADAEVDELVKTCERLLKEHEAHDIVCTHLADFSVREDCVRPHADALKTELRSSLTTTVLTFPHYDSSNSNGEQMDDKTRVEELQEWIDVKTQKGTYVKLLERLNTTKEMIKEHVDILFQDSGS